MALVGLVASPLAWSAPAPSSVPSEMGARLERLASRVPGHRVGICIREIPSGRVLYQRQAGSLYELASNTKLLTTAAALDTLGGDYGFVTRLYARGELDYFGNLDGDIVITGTGDPSLTGKLRAGSLEGVVAQWAASVKELGIRSVMGNIVVDGSVAGTAIADNSQGGDFDEDDDEAEDEDEEDEDDESIAPTEALILLVTAGPTAGKRANLSVRPAGTSLKVINSCFTVPGPTRQVKVTRARNGTIVVNGKIGQGAGTVTHILAYGDPGLQAASLLRETLPRQGVPVLGDVTISRTASGAEAKLVTESRAELAATLDIVNKHSHNLTAEEILRVMGSRSSGASGSGAQSAGCRVVGDFLKGQGIAPATFSIADGSGLSHSNRMTPESMSQLLVAMAASPNAAIYKASLARPGEDGTLRGRLSTAERYARVAAKTGHISGVNTLSGYLDTSRGAYAFSVLTNGKSRLDNGFVDAVTTQIASALAVSDGSIAPADGAPEPSWTKAKAKSRSKHGKSKKHKSGKSHSKSSKSKKSGKR